MAFGDLIRTFPSAVTVPMAITFDGKHLIYSCITGQTLYWADPLTGATIKSVAMGREITGLAYADGQIYACDDTNNLILLLDMNGNIVKTWATFGTPYGIEVVGQHIYISNLTTGIYVFPRNPPSFVAAQSINLFAFAWACGICTDGKDFYTRTGYPDTSVHKVDAQFRVIHTVVMVGAGVSDFAFDGVHLWVAMRALNRIGCVSLN